MRGIRVAIDVVVGWVEEAVVMGMAVVDEGLCLEQLHRLGKVITALIRL